MSRDVKMDAQLGVSKEGYAGRMEVLSGPTADSDEGALSIGIQIWL